MDNSLGLPMTDPEYVVYAVSRHMVRPVKNLNSPADRRNMSLVLRMVEEHPFFYFSPTLMDDWDEDDDWHDAPVIPQLDFLPVSVRHDPDVLSAVLSHGEYIYDERGIYLFFDETQAASALATNVVGPLLQKDEALSRNVILRLMHDSRVSREQLFSFLHMSARDDEELMRHLQWKARHRLRHMIRYYRAGHSERTRLLDGVLRFASARLRDDREFVLWSVLLDSTNFEHASDRLRSDRDLVLELLNTLPRVDARSMVVPYISDSIRENDPAIRNSVMACQEDPVQIESRWSTAFLWGWLRLISSSRWVVQLRYVLMGIVVGFCAIIWLPPLVLAGRDKQDFS